MACRLLSVLEKDPDEGSKILTDQFKHSKLCLHLISMRVIQPDLWTTYRPEYESNDCEIVISLPLLETDNPPPCKNAKKDDDNPKSVFCPCLRLERGCCLCGLHSLVNLRARCPHDRHLEGRCETWYLTHTHTPSRLSLGTRCSPCSGPVRCTFSLFLYFHQNTGHSKSR